MLAYLKTLAPKILIAPHAICIRARCAGYYPATLTRGRCTPPLYPPSRGACPASSLHPPSDRIADQPLAPFGRCITNQFVPVSNTPVMSRQPITARTTGLHLWRIFRLAEKPPIATLRLCNSPASMIAGGHRDGEHRLSALAGGFNAACGPHRTGNGYRTRCATSARSRIALAHAKRR